MSKGNPKIDRDNLKDRARHQRSLPILGEEGLGRLRSSHVFVAGLGGVGGFALEALARAGVGNFSICDFDVVDITNINRQIHALSSTVGLPKTEAAETRARDINPGVRIRVLNFRIDESSIGDIDFSSFDYVVDAVDDVEAKLLLIQGAKAAGAPVISCMGAGGRTDPLRFKVADIEDSHTCPLAKAVRKRAKALGIESFKVVFSDEKPVGLDTKPAESDSGKLIPSLSFVPAAAGLVMAGEVIKDIAFGQNR